MAVVKAAQFGLCHDSAAFHHLTIYRTLFPDPHRCVRDRWESAYAAERPFKYQAFQNHERVQALPAYGWSDQALLLAFGKKASMGGQHLLNPSFCSCLRTSVPETQSRSRIGYRGTFDRPRLDRLRCNPVGGGMVGDVEMLMTATACGGR
jgi:hypothetical protein